MPAIHIHQDAALLADYADLAGRAERAGYDRIWVGEINDVDAVTAAALATVGTHTADIGVFVNVFTRAPTTLAMTAATLAHLAPGRVQIVLGVGSPLFVERWNGIAFRRLLPRLRDTLRFLRLALSGERVRERFETIDTDGFRLAARPDPPPELHLAASGPRSLALAAAEADGVALNWITPGDVAHTTPLPDRPGAVSVVTSVCPTPDREVMERTMRPTVANYLSIEGYADQHRRLGRGSVLAPLWDAWARGEPAGAARAVPSELLDELIVWGTPDRCRDRLHQIEAATGARAIATVFPPPGSSFAATGLL